ncbi:hypothetical protein RHGRI_012274 [Rhododendron griersonianum]|uniref:FLZ-type domain-containing protein n=1 Tax=Rhododendron griersonianum TaxID=479676 RepID=A0AAV6KPT0_9ERIC|nr:hypothetical protein RHGRI_012274 [Rhododendron griersonianum]
MPCSSSSSRKESINANPNSHMTTKRARVFRSSSTGGFGVLNQLVRSPVIPSEKKRATAVASPVILPKPVQKPVVNVGSKAAAVRVLPEHPRRSIFTVGSAAEKEKDEKKEDERRWEFPLSCFHCKKEIGENKDVFMYGYLRAFCSTKCREIQIELEDRDREPSPGPRNRDRAPAAVAAATQPRQEPAKRIVRSPVKKYTIAKFN